MTNINAFATQVVQNATGAKNALGGQALGGNGLFGATNGAAFWEIILGGVENSAEAGDKANTQSDLNNKALGKDTVRAEKADLALLQLALMGQDPDQSLEEKLAALKIERLAATKENRVEQLTKLIDNLTTGLPQSAVENGTIEQLVTRLEKRLEKLEGSLDVLRNGNFDDADTPFKTLIATGLNPLQLTKITDRIHEVENKLGRELTIDDLIAGVGNIIPAPGNDESEFTPIDALALIIESNNKDNKEEIIATVDTDLSDNSPLHSVGIPVPQNDMNKVIHDSTNSADVPRKQQAAQTLSSIIDRLNAGKIQPASVQNSAAAASTTNGVDDAITQAPLGDDGLPLEGERLNNADFKAIFGASKKAMPSTAQNNLGMASSVVANTPAAQKVQSLLQFTFAEPTTTQNISDALGFDIQAGSPFSNAMQAVTATTAQHNAGQMHPGTQAVAAQISKSAQNGSTRGITLQLDPPELGRVEVRLEFGKDKSVKAMMMIEKPETYLLLQRDAQALERALQQAGLETDANSLEYQLAADDYNFNSGKDGNGGNDQNANGRGDGDIEDGEDDMEIIETSMTWDVNPETGHVHYNILA